MYLDPAAEYDGNGEFALRFAIYIFLEDKFSYSASSSTFTKDSTNFDIERAALIELGDSYAKVVDLVGEPSGRSVDRGEDNYQATMFPERFDDYITEDNSVRVVDVFIDSLDLSGLGFKTVAENTGRPGYHPSTMLKLYVYGYLKRAQSSRRLEREAQRNVTLS